MGMDPSLERIPLKGEPENVIINFYTQILEALKAEQIFPAMVKPNYAFYAQYGWGGLRALKKVITLYKQEGIPVLLDAKRGDIGKTSEAYAREVFDFWEADAVTIAPYMGSDSVGPFIEYCKKGKGVYVLNRTSNKGAVDLQNLKVDDVPVYLKTSENILKWYKEGVGAVIGATYSSELEEISAFFVNSQKKVPFLIPGVGAQGGSAKEVVTALKKSGNEIPMHRINSSSGINYAYEKMETDDFAGAAVKALQQLHKEISFSEDN